MSEPTPAELRDRPGAHYSAGRRYSHISQAWIFEEHWNDREECAYLKTKLDEARKERDEHRGCAIALERQLAAPPPSAPVSAGDAWQPIESAPRDGTRVLLGWNSGEPTRFGFFQRNADWKGWRPTSLEVGFPSKQPTHWQPLPPSPGAKGDGR